MVNLPILISDNLSLRFIVDNGSVTVGVGPHLSTSPDGVVVKEFHLSDGSFIIVREIGKGFLEVDAPGRIVANEGYSVVGNIATLTVIKKPPTT